MLGTDMRKSLAQSGYVVVPKNYDELDISEKEGLCKALDEVRPAIVINCAAYTDVDGCEINTEKAFAVNAQAVRKIAESCKERGVKLIHYSTDYIFDGQKGKPYNEYDTALPLNVYGRAKLKGEYYITNLMDDYVIIRTSWLFGKNGRNFVTAILELANEKEEIRVVNDQIGSPTYTENLAQATESLISHKAQGIFNVTNSGACSWYYFALKIIELSNIHRVKIIPVSSKEMDLPAQRPKNSTLDNTKFYNLTKFKMPHWEEALKNFILRGLKLHLKGVRISR